MIVCSHTTLHPASPLLCGAEERQKNCTLRQWGGGQHKWCASRTFHSRPVSCAACPSFHTAPARPFRAQMSQHRGACMQLEASGRWPGPCVHVSDNPSCDHLYVCPPCICCRVRRGRRLVKPLYLTISCKTPKPLTFFGPVQAVKPKPFSDPKYQK